MERMLCAGCAAVTYSAAAKKLVERGERCPQCGGQLTLESPDTVGVAPERAKPAERSRA
jgi:hypothetical protein